MLFVFQEIISTEVTWEAFRRLNLETRTLCEKDLKRFHIPKNIDNNNLTKQGKWFKSLHNSKFYKKD